MSSIPPPPPSSAEPAPAATYCYRHPDRETGRRCTRCGRPACPDCLRDAAVGSHCRECLKASAPTVRHQARMWNARQHFLVSAVIISVNVLVFVIGMLWPSDHGIPGSDVFLDKWALYGPSIHFDGEWWRIVTGGFLHAGFFHVFMNMAALAQFGSVLEAALGRIRFITLYSVSLLAGAAGALLVTPHSPTVGASGAIFGLLGALAIVVHRRGMNIWRSGIGGLIVVNLLITFLVPNISAGGHIGGMVGGLAAGTALLHREPDGRPAAWGIPVAVLIAVVSVAVALVAAGR